MPPDHAVPLFKGLQQTVNGLTEKLDHDRQLPLWIAYFHEGAKCADIVSEYTFDEATANQFIRSSIHQKKVDGICRQHESVNCTQPICITSPKLLLFQGDWLHNNAKGLTWMSKMSTYFRSMDVPQPAIDCLLHLQRNVSTIVRPRYGDHTALCFAWTSLLPRENATVDATGAIECEVYKMRAFVMQVATQIVIEFDESPVAIRLSKPIHRALVEPHVRKNLVSRLAFSENCNRNIWSLKRLTIETLCYLILDDESLVLTEIGYLLIRIEEDLCSKRLSGSDADKWRVELGKWRAHLHTINGWCTRYIHNVKVLGINDDERLRSTGFNTAQKELRQRLEIVIHDMELFQTRIRIVLDHVESTFTALIGTIQIAQAGQVGRITMLAFFFLPLTLVVGVFGMHVVRTDRRI